ncbi:MAG: glycoside hydrolase family 3 C-terminal domain-containing protein [Acidobacteriaceae bacterium]
MNPRIIAKTCRRSSIAQFITIGLLVCGALTFAQGPAKHHRPTPADAPAVVTGNARVDKLLDEMTLDEKIGMIHGMHENPATFQGQAGYLPGIPRLGIPSLRLADGPPGVLTRVPSTALTATMGVAATFSRDDARQNGIVIARDARSLGIDVVLQPFINMDRDLTWERGYNTFGEDPLLTGQIGAAEIRGIQSQGILSQAKHYVGYDGGMDVVIGQQALHEIYVAPFAAASNAGVSSIMCSYNKINGLYACGNPDTLITILRHQVEFKGFVTSDWGANHGTNFINNGLDLEMPGPILKDTPSYFAADMPARDTAKTMRDAVQSGQVSEATITHAVGRILLQMDRFGLLDGKSKHNITPIDTAFDAPIVQKTAEDAAVLLKNSGDALPLTKEDLGSLALIGPGAGQTMAIGIADEKAVGLPAREVGTLYALKKDLADQPNVHITYAVADDMTGALIPAEFLSHDGKDGLERASATGQFQGVDAQVSFTIFNGHALPANSTYGWTGTLKVPETGTYMLYLQNLGCYASLILDGKKLASNHQMVIHGDITQAGQDNVLPTTDGLDDLRVKIHLDAGPHALHVSVRPDTSNHPTQVRLSWVTPAQQKKNYDAAIAAARHARTAVVFAWSADDPVFHLAGNQDKLIADIAAVNPNTIVVLNVTQPVAMPWLSKVKGVLQMWFPGDEGGWATANVLLGKISPAGRLPFTWPQRLDQGVANDPAHPERESHPEGQGKTIYSEGIFMGYRWYDQQKLTPLFPFGYGLSYTHFQYSAIKVGRAADGVLDVSFQLRNTGHTASDEVPQVYLDAPEHPPGGAQFAVRALAAFDRIHLDAGQSREITLHVPFRSLQYWSTASNRWMLATGLRKVQVGASSRDLRLEKTINVAQ